MKKLNELYASPTPAKWRKLGDSLLAISTLITTYAIADDWSKYAQLGALILGVVGKFLTNFFSEN
jgi:hypothetical protein